MPFALDISDCNEGERVESKAVSRRNAGVTTLGRLYQFHLRRGNAERFSSRPIRRVKIHFRSATAAVAALLREDELCYDCLTHPCDTTNY